MVKKLGGNMTDSYLDEGESIAIMTWKTDGIVRILLGFLLDKRPGMHQPKRIENANILIANTPMDTDKIKVEFN